MPRSSLQLIFKFKKIMNKILLILVIAFFAIMEPANANKNKCSIIIPIETLIDTGRVAELDVFWNELSRTVREGDFEGYKAANHEDAVVVFTTSENKASVSISSQLEDWKQDFTDVQTGKSKNNVQFRFSQRIGSETTAHEIGIFYYTSIDRNGKFVANAFIHFESLLVKRNGKWLQLMEYQKAKATEKEWKALE